MKEITVAQLRKQTKYFFDAVEEGNIIRVCRKGKPIAEIIPFPKPKPSWKREVPGITLPGVVVSAEILKDRAETEK